MPSPAGVNSLAGLYLEIGRVEILASSGCIPWVIIALPEGPRHQVMVLSESLAGDKKVCICVHMLTHACVHSCVYVSMWAHVKTTDQYQMSFFVTLYIFVFLKWVPHWTQRSLKLDWLPISPRDATVVASQILELNMCAAFLSFLCGCWRSEVMSSHWHNSALFTNVSSQPQEGPHYLLSPSSRTSDGAITFYTQSLLATAFVSRCLPC